MTLRDFPNILFITSKASDGNMRPDLGDPVETLENQKRFFNSLGINKSHIIQCHLQLGNKVIMVDTKDLEKDNGADEKFKCDGALTQEKRLYLFIVTADCMPIGIYDPIHEAVALIHSGWQGLETGILENALSLMKEKFHTNPEDLVVEIAPSIGPCCYIYRTNFSKPNSTLETLQNSPKWKSYLKKLDENSYSIDLWSHAEDQLKTLGVKEENITNQKICVYHTPGYFSHSKAVVENTGEDYRIGTVLGLKP